MSLRIVTATALLAALTPNMADAATWSHHRHYQASMPESNLTAHYAPTYYSRYDRAVLAPSPYAPASGQGVFEEIKSAP